jgi:uncharacterized protein (TIGR02594 family)
MTGMLLFSIALFTTPASARSLNKAPGFSGLIHQPAGVSEFTEMSARRRHHAARHHARRSHAARRHVPRRSRAAVMRRRGHDMGATPHGVAASSYASAVHNSGAVPDVGGVGLVAEARRYIGTNPTGRSALWCATFMNMVLQRSGHSGSGSNLARSFASYGRRISGPQVGAIAVMSRGRRGGHVGVVSGIDASGNPIIISGNHGRRVAESTYSRARIYAYVMP